MKLKFTELNREADNSIIIVVIFNTSLSTWWTARQNIRKDMADLSVIGIYRTSYPTAQNRHSFQEHMLCLSGQTISWAVKQVSINSKSLKSYKECSLVTMQLY